MFTPPTDPAGALRLHYNENTAGSSPAVLEALRSLTREDISEYPDYTAITSRVAGWLGVAADRVALVSGLDDGLRVITQYGRWFSESGSTSGETPRRCEFVVPEPAFEMFEAFARVVHADIVHVPPGPDFAFPLDAVLAAITPATRVVYLVDPNNPTGLPLPDGAAEAIAAAAPSALVFVDEAYADFSGRTLIGPALDRHPNLVVGRTFAKGHGLAALRIGALVAHPHTMRRLSRVIPPFTVNIAAVRALEAALDDDAYARWYVAQAAESRALTFDFCRRHGLTAWPSVANFVLIRIGDDAGRVVSALAERGILVRDKSNAPGCAGCLRITTGIVDHTTRMLAALEDVLASRTN